MCCIGSYWLHGKCTQIFTGDFLCVVTGERDCLQLLFVEAQRGDAASASVKVSDVTMQELM